MIINYQLKPGEVFVMRRKEVMKMKDWKTSSIGICTAFIAMFTLIIHVVQGQAVDLPTVMQTVNLLAMSLGFHLAGDSTPVIKT